MAKDPAFLFYPGDWLGGTILMTREEKGAYMDLLMAQFHGGHMTSHMIQHMLGHDYDRLWSKLKSKFQVDDEGRFYNERLEFEKNKRKRYSDSRSNNKKGKNQHTKKEEKGGHMTSHMGNENINRDENINRGGVGEILKPVNPELMGFKGRCRVWLEQEHKYIWTEDDNQAIDDLRKKIKILNGHEIGMSTLDIEVAKFQLIITNLDPWVKAKKFSLNYINDHFNEVKNGKNESSKTNGHDHKRGLSLAAKTEFSDGGEL